jgi:hypothetical protein
MIATHISRGSAIFVWQRGTHQPEWIIGKSPMRGGTIPGGPSDDFPSDVSQCGFLVASDELFKLEFLRLRFLESALWNPVSHTRGVPPSRESTAEFLVSNEVCREKRLRRLCGAERRQPWGAVLIHKHRSG